MVAYCYIASLASILASMDRFVIRTKVRRSLSQSCNDSSEDSSTPSAKRSCTQDQPHCGESSFSSDASSRMKSYKSKLRYNPEWRSKWTWIEYDDAIGGMLCSICSDFQPCILYRIWKQKILRMYLSVLRPYKLHS